MLSDRPERCKPGDQKRWSVNQVRTEIRNLPIFDFCLSHFGITSNRFKFNINAESNHPLWGSRPNDERPTAFQFVAIRRVKGAMHGMGVGKPVSQVAQDQGLEGQRSLRQQLCLTSSMKTITAISAALSLTAGALGVAQMKAPVVVAGGSPATPLPTFYQQYNGDIVISYGTGAVNENIVIPGHSPSRVFTNELGEIGMIWSPLPPVQPVVIAPADPIPPPVVSPVSPNPLAHYFTNADGSIVIYWR
jgi:hypothetical protein